MRRFAKVEFYKRGFRGSRAAPPGLPFLEYWTGSVIRETQLGMGVGSAFHHGSRSLSGICPLGRAKENLVEIPKW